MSTEATPLDLKYALFTVVSGVVQQRSAEPSGGARPRPAAPQGVTEHVRAHAASLDDAALTALHVELGRGFLLDIDRSISQRQAEPG